MMTLRNILTLLILTSKVNGQSVDRTYQGWWARTSWTFKFNNDNTYTRTSTGHFGNTSYDGKYEITDDTIVLITGSEQITGIQRPKYLLDKDSLLIDLQLFYDYKLNTRSNFYSSKKRYDILKKPNMDSLVVVSRQQFDTIVEHCIFLLTTRRNIQLKDEDHIKIIRLINTINMSKDPSFKSGIYSEFMTRVKEKDYKNDVSIYYDWIPNRGMGFYFQKLQIELGGTPHFFSRFVVE